MLNFKLPLNFDSPYKAKNIIDFWRRWHMTLSRFLRDMLYIPLGGNRHGTMRRHLNLFITMVLGGLWHGAGWNFLIWGGLHGAYLVVNHTWVSVRTRRFQSVKLGRWARLCVDQLSVLLTFGAVLLGWVFFRATDAQAAYAMLLGLVGAGGPAEVAASNSVLAGVAWVGLGYGIARLCPNSQQLLAPHEPALPAIDKAARRPWAWTPTWAALTALLGTASMLGFTRVSEFLYFQF